MQDLVPHAWSSAAPCVNPWPPHRRRRDRRGRPRARRWPAPTTGRCGGSQSGGRPCVHGPAPNPRQEQGGPPAVLKPSRLRGRAASAGSPGACRAPCAGSAGGGAAPAASPARTRAARRPAARRAPPAAPTPAACCPRLRAGAGGRHPCRRLEAGKSAHERRAQGCCNPQASTQLSGVPPASTWVVAFLPLAMKLAVRVPPSLLTAASRSALLRRRRGGQGGRVSAGKGTTLPYYLPRWLQNKRQPKAVKGSLWGLPTTTRALTCTPPSWRSRRWTP